MSVGLQAVREELRVLARMHGAGSDCKALCLALIDRTATCASERHGEIPEDVLGYLMRAMHASGRGDVAGVIEEVEGAVALLGGQHQKPVRQRPALATTKGPARSRPPDGRVYQPKSVAQRIDPLLAKLRAKKGLKT